MGCYGQAKFITGTLSISTMLESPGLSFHQLLTMPGLISEKLQDSWDMYKPCVIERKSPGSQTDSNLFCSLLGIHLEFFQHSNLRDNSMFFFLRTLNKTGYGSVLPSIQWQIQAEIRCQAMVQE